MLGITQKHLSQIETGRVGISNLLISSICSHFAVNRQWLEQGTGYMWRGNEQTEPGPSGVSEGSRAYLPLRDDPPDMAELIEKLISILRSDDTVTKEATRQAIIAFYTSTLRAEKKPGG